MKKEIASAPIFAYYSPKKQSVLQTDAIIKGLGTCLLQEEISVYFASKAVTDAQWGYVAIEIRIACSCLGNEEIPSFPVCKSFHLEKQSEALRSNFIQEH